MKLSNLLLRWVMLSGLLVGLGACAQPPIASAARVQCRIEGEVVFDQHFDRAELLSNGHVKVWLGEENVELVDDCQIVPVADH
jgi:hypothetical protein